LKKQKDELVETYKKFDADKSDLERQIHFLDKEIE
jgi:hypothetical protein